MKAELSCGAGGGSRPLNVARLDMWVASSRPGSCLLLGAGQHASQAMARAVQDRVLALAEAGLVHPVQRRLAGGASLFSYELQRAGRGLPPLWPKLGEPLRRPVTKVGGR